MRLPKSGKDLHETTLHTVFISKYLSQEDQIANKKLRDQCTKRNDLCGNMPGGEKRFVVYNKSIRRRRDSGHLDVCSEIDHDKLLASPQPGVAEHDSDSDSA